VPTKTERRPAVLIVGDDIVLRRIMRRTLEAEGHYVLEASDGVDALSILEQHMPVDVVVTELCMPGMDGWELAGKLAERSPRIPSLFLSGYESHPDTARLPGPVLAKPFMPVQLVASVDQLLLSSPIH
jgi:CheY-like chemotaxis protein